MTESTLVHSTAENSTSNTTTTSHHHSKMEPPVSPTPSEQQYALKWNDFQASILSSFRHLRDEEDFVDVTLACDRRSFTAHKVVLSACSPYFRKLLKANPCEHPIVILRDVRAEDVESLLRFMYNGEVNIGHEQLSDFLKTAQLLQVRGLADVTGPGGRGGASAGYSSTPISAQHPSNNSSSNINTSSNNQSHNNSGGNLNIASSGHNINNNNILSHNQNSNSTPSIQELKPTPGGIMSWDDDRSSGHHLNTPPPQKRIKSIDLYRAQHGLSPDRNVSPPRNQRSLSRDRERELMERHDDERSHKSRDRSLELRESLLGQALEGGPTLIVPTQKHPDLAALQAQSNEDSNSSDGQASDRDEDGMEGLNGSMDHNRSSFPSAFLSLQGLPLMPGPSGIHADNFVSRRSLEMRVRATDPRPCPKCGKIYRSAHTLRTHLEDKHTVCPGYRCVLCGTVAKSRNSLHSHMSRQHRGISTKDLPVLPMPSPFDPELASRLLAKAGVKISPAELRARASPTSGTRRNDIKLEMRGPGDDLSNMDDMDDDPEDLTMGGGGTGGGPMHGGHPIGNSNNHSSSTSSSTVSPNNNNNLNNIGNGGRYFDAFNHPNTTITRVRHGALTPKSQESMGGKDNQHMQANAATGSAILDTYLQFITENTFGMGMTQEQAAAAIHAAKMAQLGAMGHNLDKLPPGFLPPQLDLAKLANHNNNNNNNSNNNNLDVLGKIQQNTNVTIEPSSQKQRDDLRHEMQSRRDKSDRNLEIRRDMEHEPMDLGLESGNNGQSQMQNDSVGGGGSATGHSSAEEGNYSDEEGVAAS